MKPQMSKPVKALILFRSGEMRDALQALLESIERIGTIYQAQDAQTGNDILEAHHPGLLLTEFTLVHAVTAHPDVRIMVLAEDRHEQEHACTAGFTWVFIKGTPVGQLIKAIEAWLARRV